MADSDKRIRYHSSTTRRSRINQMVISVIFGAAAAAFTVYVLAHILTLNVYVGP